MKNVPAYLFMTGLMLGNLPQQAAAQQSPRHLLWQIGKPDNAGSEFALAPKGDRSYDRDGFFVVGRSAEKKDWPYGHPGPQDGWGGNAPHTFYIFFGVKRLVPGDSCRLVLKVADVGNSDVALTITVNGHEYQSTLQKGSGRGIRGDLTNAKEQECSLSIPTGILLTGDNKIGITSRTGSWFIYDWVGFETPVGIVPAPVHPSITCPDGQSLSVVAIRDGHHFQKAELSLFNTGDSADITIKIPGVNDQHMGLATGATKAEILTPEVLKDSTVQLSITRGNVLIGKRDQPLRPAPHMTIYILPHSHNDIGYTEIQSNVEKKQIDNLLKGIEYARRTKDYPEGARFVWNLEGLYAADLYLQRMNTQQRSDLYAAIKDGGVALNGMYLNTLTGLCRPEELLNLFKFSGELSKKCGVVTDAAMISDVPGYTWGTVTAMAQAGIKYFSAAPNNFDRIGDILEQWENKPFYWVSPSGKEKVLVWIPYRGYALSHGIPGLSPKFVSFYMDKLKEVGYPYDISYIRWSGHGDNAVPEIEISDFVKDWNTRNAWPHFIISSTSTAFTAFEKKFGTRLPSFKGDWTGYWEDGSGSSAFETAENRASSSRLTQAETLWALADPAHYPAERFAKAWQQTILYSEHTWGADVSVTNPLSQKTIEQWAIKKSYADSAGQLSLSLLNEAVTGSSSATAPGAATGASTAPAAGDSIDVFNTHSWSASGLVLVTPQLSAKGDVIKDLHGVTVPSQRLSTGELAFVAKDIPPFAARRFYMSAQRSAKASPATRPTPAIRTTRAIKPSPADAANSAGAAMETSDHSLGNGLVRIATDPVTGAITSIRDEKSGNNFVDSATGNYVNDYLFLNGNNLADLKRNGPVKSLIKEKGPVLSVLRLESDAPGCNKLVREIRLVNGFDYFEMINILDKKPAELNPHPGDYAWANTGGKESVHFGFPFNIADGQLHVNIPMAIMQPEIDQIPGSCKNWLEVGEWADVSNKDVGVTWASLDAPLIEVGDITATLLGGQTNPAIWRKKIAPTQKFYSWALNNHWETNYRAYQDGIITFRYAIQPHRSFDAVSATRFATGLSQPLIVAAAGKKDWSGSGLTLTSDKIIVQVLKPSEDGKAWIVTLFNPSNHPEKTRLQWPVATGPATYSNTTEKTMEPIAGDLTLSAMDVVTLRVERL
jgi:alpha-mannosidase